MSRARRWIVVGFAVFAAARVLLFASAFPLFNNVDEQAHVDLVLKFSHGEWPAALGHMGGEASELFTRYGSSEYLRPQGAPAVVTEPWRGELSPDMRGVAELWQQARNYESGEPPLYYAIAGLFWRLLAALGANGALPIFLIRFLNVIPAVTAVLLATRAAELIGGASDRRAICAAGFAAMIPQDAFYSVASDAWSVLWCGLAFVFALKLASAPRPSVGVAAAAGLSLAAAVATKLANLPLLGVVAAYLLLQPAFRKSPATLIAFFAGALVPVALLFARNYSTFGDYTATAAKVQHLQWTAKPIGEWLPHPLLTLSGFNRFWAELTASFWRGEFVWHLHRLASPAADWFYTVATTMILGAGAFIAILQRNRVVAERRAAAFAVACVGGLIAFVVFLSVHYDFGDAGYPSRTAPFFTSGRLLLGALVPFATVAGLVADRVIRRLSTIALVVSLVLLTAAITWNEIALSRPAFGSSFNLFHLH